MIVVDSSVIVAIFRGEPEADEFVEKLARSERSLMSAANRLEATIVCLGPRGGQKVSDLVEAIVARFRIEIAPVTPEQADRAIAAFQAYGRGRGGKAQLNFGDCFAYALARAVDAPLLFKGRDFTHTDVTAA